MNDKNNNTDERGLVRVEWQRSLECVALAAGSCVCVECVCFETFVENFDSDHRVLIAVSKPIRHLQETSGAFVVDRRTR